MTDEPSSNSTAKHCRPAVIGERYVTWQILPAASKTRSPTFRAPCVVHPSGVGTGVSSASGAPHYISAPPPPSSPTPRSPPPPLPPPFPLLPLTSPYPPLAPPAHPRAGNELLPGAALDGWAAPPALAVAQEREEADAVERMLEAEGEAALKAVAPVAEMALAGEAREPAGGDLALDDVQGIGADRIPLIRRPLLRAPRPHSRRPIPARLRPRRP